ncbi:glutathione S-transferase family protein [Salaquimonas pukyongi]|uniref:glutathione S-transferase family protein n=1 Tax=Salaquimonas pukyongi TaxID=2712698 RepID=UPI00096B7BCE|nr:glutathione S-transferase family protein [Salaquimonas pukyongi]
MIQLYHHPMSGASRYIRLILGEYGVPAEFIEEKTWLRREEFLTLNPAGTVPVLVDDAVSKNRDTTPAAVAGAMVIGEYLDETVGAMMREKRLMPENSATRAEMRRLVEWFIHKFEAEVGRYLVQERIWKHLMRGDGMGGAPDSAMIRAGRTNLKSHLRYLDWLVQSRNWLGGNRLSLSDLAAAAALSVPDYLGEIPWDSEPAVRDWYARVKSRPSFRPILADKLAGLPPASHYVDLDF